MALALIVRLFFMEYTNRTMEDALITLAHAENCVHGHGLTHHISEPRVQGFTSPISALINIIGVWLIPQHGLLLIKLTSAFYSMIAVFFVMQICRHHKVQLPLFLAILPMLFVACEHHQIYFGMSGLETQIATTVFIMSIYALISDQTFLLGISLGLCMLCRPDFGFWALIIGGYYLYKTPQKLPRIVIAAVVIYGPWLCFATWYYGSPIPNSLLAKSLAYSHWWEQPDLTTSNIKRTIVDKTVYRIFEMLVPGYDLHALHSWSHWISCGLMAIAVIGGFIALRHRSWFLLPLYLYVFVYWIYYVFLVPFIAGWYLVPFTALLPILIAIGIHNVARLTPNPGWLKFIQTAGIVIYLTYLLSILPLTFSADRQIQHYVENDVRRHIGYYLRNLMRDDDTAICEPLGYIGYYSQKTIYDWPGLGSKKVTTFLNTYPNRRTMNDSIAYFKPTYLVLRSQELEALQKDNKNRLDKCYQVIHSFQPDPKAPAWIQQHYDARYTLLKRI